MSDKWGVGNKADAKAFATVKVGGQTAELILGEHPHSRSDNNIYARFPGDPPAIEGFDGHRICTKVELEEYNYLKQSELSGDEVRKAGSGKIYFDGILCYEFFFRDVEEALLTARTKIRNLKEHPSDWGVKERRKKLKGRIIARDKVRYYIRSLIVNQGCLILLVPGANDMGHDFLKVEVDDPKLDWFPDDHVQYFPIKEEE